MAAGAWVFYRKAKQHICDGTIDMDSSRFRMALYTSASNAATDTFSTVSQVTGEVSPVNGYVAQGKIMTTTWGQGASTGEARFNSNSVIWSAVGGDIPSVKFAVIWISGASTLARKLLVYSQLSAAQFTVTSGNTLTVTPSANGIFELN